MLTGWLEYKFKVTQTSAETKSLWNDTGVLSPDPPARLPEAALPLDASGWASAKNLGLTFKP